MILAGIAVMYLFNACTTLIKLGASDASLSAVFQWSIGDLSGATWQSFYVILVFTVVGSAILMAMSKKLNILITGDKSATALGLNAHRLRIMLLAIISLMTASVVCFTGIIGFIGLVAPHIVRIPRIRQQISDTSLRSVRSIASDGCRLDLKSDHCPHIPPSRSDYGIHRMSSVPISPDQAEKEHVVIG